MEMSPEYLAKTAHHLQAQGYSLAEEDVPYGEVPEGKCEGRRYVLTKPDVQLILEVVRHPKEGVRYFLELVQYHGLSISSFPLDSWKFFKDRVEFKFYTLPDTGLGLSFILR